MRTLRRATDRAATRTARALLGWVAPQVDPSRRVWIEAMRAELDVIDSGGAQLFWAVGSLRVFWRLEGKQQMTRASGKWGGLVALVLLIAVAPLILPVGAGMLLLVGALRRSGWLAPLSGLSPDARMMWRSSAAGLGRSGRPCSR